MASHVVQDNRFRRLLLFLVLSSFLIGPGATAAQEPRQQNPAAAPVQVPQKAPQEKKAEYPAQQLSEKVVTELRIVPYRRLQKPDPTMPRGMVKILQRGRQGRERVTYQIKMVDGRTVERIVLGTEVLSPPKPHVELIGTAPVVSQRTLMEILPIPFQREQKPDETLPAGTVKVVREGREGKEQITYRIRMVDGKETERVVIRSDVLSPPENQMEWVGTGKTVQAPPASPPPEPKKEEK